MKALKIPLITILCLTVLATQVSATYPPSIYLYDLPATATYTIKSTDGTNYWYVRSDGFTATSTNASVILGGAINALTSGTIYIWAGTYYITTSLTSYFKVGNSKHISIIGSGMNQTILKVSSTVNSTSLFYGDETADLSLSSLTLNFSTSKSGNKINNGFDKLTLDHVQALGNITIASQISGYAFCGENENFAHYVSIHDCIIRDFAYGLWISGTDYCDISNNVIINCQAVGAVVTDWAKHSTVVIAHNQLVDCGLVDEALGLDVGWGTADTLSVNAQISGNILTYATAPPDNIGIVNIGGADAVIEGNKFFCDLPNTNQNYTAIYAGNILTSPISNVTIQNNEVLSTYYGIRLENAMDSTIQNNHVRLINNQTLRGVYVTYADHTVMWGNTTLLDNYIEIVDRISTGYGIYVYSGTHPYGKGQVNVIGNTVITNETGVYWNVASSNLTGFIDDNHLALTNNDITINAGTVYYREQYGVNSTAADGGSQAIKLIGTPTYVFVTSGNSTDAIICAAVSFASNHFHYELNNDEGAAVTGQKVYWYAVYDP